MNEYSYRYNVCLVQFANFSKFSTRKHYCWFALINFTYYVLLVSYLTLRFGSIGLHISVSR